MKQVFEECFLREPQVPCGTVLDLFQKRFGERRNNDDDDDDSSSSTNNNDDKIHLASRIAILQIDTEGYEGILLPNLFREWEQHELILPPVIHYESKIMRKWLRKGKNNVLQQIHDTLEDKGYIIYQGREDDLAIQISMPLS